MEDRIQLTEEMVFLFYKTEVKDKKIDRSEG